MKRKERDCNNDNEEEDEKDTNTTIAVKLTATTALIVGYDPIDDQHKALSLKRKRSERLSLINALNETNKAGEIIIAPKRLSLNFRPFYIFYYNVETKNMRRVKLLGFGDSEEFRRSYGFERTAGSRESLVLIAHNHTSSFFKDPRINLT
ncbi:hypothetical protein ISN44_As01g031030 [Arabidopsis suecica]|uniref:F-box associated beta-propeller type 3 domain-containing protein n=1 Tax=Arabidopsis suecica TaxID=45249 RepID=A0A8T2H740_ARASU|nr:hypothetical protein ISN44_As01g031030 [Arabidopsis suecica]